MAVRTQRDYFVPPNTVVEAPIVIVMTHRVCHRFVAACVNYAKQETLREF